MATKNIFIGICGGSASGKTTFCSYLLKHFQGNAQIISQDAYYHDRTGMPVSELEKVNFDSPDSVDLELLYRDLVQLKNDNYVSLPQYCFKTHSRLTGKQKIQVKRINIVEGLFVFETKKLRALFDHKIFISADDDIRLARRIKRDIAERGRDIESILDQYMSDVKPMHIKHIESKRKHADYEINTSDDVPMDKVLESLMSAIGFVEIN